MFGTNQPLWETITYVIVTCGVGGYYGRKLIKYLFNGMGWNKSRSNKS